MIDIDALTSEPVSGPMDTRFPVLPAGEYIASISDKGPVKDWFKIIKRQDGSETPTVNIPFVVADPEVAKKMGVAVATTRLTVWLDTELDEASGKQKISRAEGKNVGLGQLREALGQNNDPSWSFDKLLGAGPLKITSDVTESKKNPGQKFSNVTRVAKL